MLRFSFSNNNEYIKIYTKGNTDKVDKSLFAVDLSFMGYKLDLTVNLKEKSTPAYFSTYGDGSVDITFELLVYNTKIAINLLKLDWESEEFVNFIDKYKSKLFIRQYFIHEFNHFLDYISQPETGWEKGGVYYSDIDSSKYWNNKQEIQAYLLQGFTEYRNDIKRGKYHSYKDFEDSFIDHVFDKYWDYINQNNKKLIKKRIYSFWQEQMNNINI